MSYVIFEHIKGTDNILAESMSHLRSIHLYNSLDLEGEGKEFGHDMFQRTPPINTDTSHSGKERTGRERVSKV